MFCTQVNYPSQSFTQIYRAQSLFPVEGSKFGDCEIFVYYQFSEKISELLIVVFKVRVLLNLGGWGQVNIKCYVTYVLFPLGTKGNSYKNSRFAPFCSGDSKHITLAKKGTVYQSL